MAYRYSRLHTLAESKASDLCERSTNDVLGRKSSEAHRTYVMVRIKDERLQWRFAARLDKKDSPNCDGAI